MPDYLAVSFSSTDYIGHLFGASSLESEDNLARLYRTLAELFAFVDKKDRAGQHLIVLSAPRPAHLPGHLLELGIRNGVTSTGCPGHGPCHRGAEEAVRYRKELIEAYFQPYVYLNRDLIRKRAWTRPSGKGRRQGTGQPAWRSRSPAPRSALPACRTPCSCADPAQLPSQAIGRIFVVFEPSVFISDFDGLSVASTHGSPWRYDTFVALMFAGADPRPGPSAVP